MNENDNLIVKLKKSYLAADMKMLDHFKRGLFFADDFLDR